MEPRIIDVRQGILKENDRRAHELRARFREAGVTVVNLLSSPGSGKTALLERTLARLSACYRVRAVVGDLATERDAERLRESGVPVVQIQTGTVCHLDAAMIEQALSEWDLNDLDFLFIENVGNLVCPASFDLGESLRVVLLSVTEGEDKPLKYPAIFHAADLVLVTKWDLALATDFDVEEAARNLAAASPAVPVLHCSARTAEGVDAWIDHLVRRRAIEAHGGSNPTQVSM